MTSWGQQQLTSVALTRRAEKTTRTQVRDGFAFLGLAISSWSVGMRPQAVEQVKTKIREWTPLAQRGLHSEFMALASAAAVTLMGTIHEPA
jgi:hypothetical protein